MSFSRELAFLILQFLNEEQLKETAHMLERETCFFFDEKYFEELLLNGNWKEAEEYLSNFTKVEDNKYSTKIYFEIRKHKYLEALDMHNSHEALDILNNDLKVFGKGNKEILEEMAQLLVLDNIREHKSLSMYGDIESARRNMAAAVKKVVQANPLICDKLNFPDLEKQRLRALINQSLNWQHRCCVNPQPNPCIETLFVDHACRLGNHPSHRSNENNLQHLQDTPTPHPTFPSATYSAVSGATSLGVPVNPVSGATSLGVPVNPDATLEPHEVSDNMSKQLHAVTLDEVTSSQSHSFASNMVNDLPMTVARRLKEGSSPTSMDFHPVQNTVLLVGTSIGDIGLWEVKSGKKLLTRNFKVWDVGVCSMTFKIALVKDSCISVNRLIWSPDGSLFGVAYSKHIVQLYSYHGGSDVRQQLEIDAHVGRVNDLAFSIPNNLLLVITCGDDKTVKVWDVVAGARMYTFEGHEASVYSVCPHLKENTHFIFSTSVDGKIKAWLYTNLGARVDYDAPGFWCTTMAYSDDGKRLFSCGTSKDGESLLVEWVENEGTIKRIYKGTSKHSLAFLQFDTTKNQILAAGDDHLIKFWDMDNVELLTTIEADGDLPARPLLRFNKDGTLLAVVGNENLIEVLGTVIGLQLLQNSEYHSTDASIPTKTVSKSRGARNLMVLKSKLTRAVNVTSKVPKLLEINKPSQCQSLKLHANVKTNKVSRLTYTHSGNGILDLTSDAIHLLWKWQKNRFNLSAKATTKVPPQLWQPKGSSIMINDVAANIENAVPCFALSKNDSYVVSASGGHVSLFSMVTFKKLFTFMQPPPTVTFLACYPQDNNIIAIGMDDSTLLIYTIREDKVLSNLSGHCKRISGLAFSSLLNVLVSASADAEIFVWNSNNWKKQKSRLTNIPDGKMPGTLTDTQVQFHQDQIHFLAVHETLLAIYEATQLECVKQWVPGKFCAPISHATFSCDSQLVYTSFHDGLVSIFDASSLELQCHINPTAYLPLSISCNAYPTVIAAHPKLPYQFALGFTDGSVYVIEPLESVGKWSPIENVPDPDFVSFD